MLWGFYVIFHNSIMGGKLSRTRLGYGPVPQEPELVPPKYDLHSEKVSESQQTIDAILSIIGSNCHPHVKFAAVDKLAKFVTRLRHGSSVHSEDARVQQIINSLSSIIESNCAGGIKLEAINNLAMFVAGLHGEPNANIQHDYYQLGCTLRRV